MTTAPEWQEQPLAALSDIQVTYHTASSRKHRYRTILRICYSGAYRDGAAGNPDARYMMAMAAAGIDAFAPHGVIHDLSHLKYDWGDMLEAVFGYGPSRKGPRAVVVGDDCRTAVGTLVHGYRSTEPAMTLEDIFDDIDEAYEYVVSIIDAE